MTVPFEPETGNADVGRLFISSQLRERFNPSASLIP